MWIFHGLLRSSNVYIDLCVSQNVILTDLVYCPRKSFHTAVLRNVGTVVTVAYLISLRSTSAFQYIWSNGFHIS
jgi:hypothetical protein